MEMYKKGLKNKINISITFYIYLFYILLIIVNDYITYIYGKESNFGTYNLALIICICLHVFVIRKHVIISKKIEKNASDILALALFAFVFIIRIAIPDNGFDTLNYHLILQQNPFADYINFHFFPGRNLNTFCYPLGDRMFFLFRSILGYRLGITLNLLVIILIYYQVKEIIKIIFPQIINIKYINALITLIALFSVVTEKTYSVMAMYYIDLLYVPLLIELVKVVLVSDNISNSKSNYIYIGLLSGIVISFKATNIVFIFLIILIYIIKILKFYKKIEIKKLVVMSIFALLPCIVYITNILVQTGSPVFPFYNAIFKSRYFMGINWLDDRYGPKNIIETIFWPFTIVFKPERTDDYTVYNGRLAVGYLICIATFIMYILKPSKENSRFKYLSLYFISFTLFWSIALIGYIRYGLLLEIFTGVIIGVLFFSLSVMKYKKIFKNILLVATSVVIVLNSAIVFKEIFISDAEGNWRQPFYKNLIAYSNNAKFLLRDKNILVDKNILEDIDAWGICDFNSGYAMMLKSDIPIISLNSGVSNELTYNMFYERLSNYKNLYTIVTADKITAAFHSLNASNFVIDYKAIKIKPSFFDQSKSLYLFKIVPKKMDENTQNEFINLILGEEGYTIDLNSISSKKSKFKALVGLNPIAESWGSDGFSMEFYITTTNKRELIHSVKIENDANLNEVTFGIDLTNYNKDDKILLEIALSNDPGKNANADWACVINPQITAIN